MPFTVSHVAAVVPLRERPGRAGLPLAALAAGSMSPDLPYFMPWLVALGAGGTLTHSPAGIATVDLVFGLVMWLVWYLLAPALRDLMPGFVRARWPAGMPRRAGVPVLCAAVLVGAITHVVWDAFTHVGRFGHTHIPALAATYPSPLGPLPGYRYLQYASGVLGLVVLGVMAARQRPGDAGGRQDPALARFFPWLLAGGVLLALALRVPALAQAPEPRTVAFLSITAAGTGLIAATVLAGALWLFRRHVRTEASR